MKRSWSFLIFPMFFFALLGLCGTSVAKEAELIGAALLFPIPFTPKCSIPTIKSMG